MVIRDPPGIVKCPACGSKNIETKWSLTTFVELSGAQIEPAAGAFPHYRESDNTWTCLATPIRALLLLAVFSG